MTILPQNGEFRFVFIIFSKRDDYDNDDSSMMTMMMMMMMMTTTTTTMTAMMMIIVMILLMILGQHISGNFPYPSCHVVTTVKCHNFIIV